MVHFPRIMNQVLSLVYTCKCPDATFYEAGL